MEDLPEDTMMSPMKYQVADNKFQERELVNVRTEDPAVVTTRREEAQEEAV